jgi:hypothetical protein
LNVIKRTKIPKRVASFGAAFESRNEDSDGIAECSETRRMGLIDAPIVCGSLKVDTVPSAMSHSKKMGE